ncbi:hypothetical protein G3N95_31510 [Paraburkholderia sp. Tr-20389]|uniref:hypothetical protein n=1 Tax=Paraburkholderia sp. Tr-20389 TaxID=2703903 RepID=UPI00197EE592|nr:hypothetical protein [Paraburkholderia sp. Tr-20389]MBN3757492.1 hypothetical protein [Paraburkholderia sp. Tr-20389]
MSEQRLDKPERRPHELTKHLDAASIDNDTRIIEALARLEDPKKRGKLKITVSSICKITGLSRNTIRNRDWALGRLKSLKQALKQGSVTPGESGSKAEATEITSNELRARIKRVLEQNALLYEEILALRDIIAKRDAHIASLQSGDNISIFPQKSAKIDNRMQE